MNKRNIFTLVLISAFIVNAVVFQSCKNESTVQPPNTNTQTPSGPTLVSPDNESTTGSLSPSLVWQSYTSAISYQVQVSLDANFAGIMIVDSSGITGTQLHVHYGKLTTNVYYYWRVKASLSENNFSPWSSVWRFNIILNPPQAPYLIAPPNGSSNQSFTPTLQWSSVDSVQFYRVQISQNSNFSNPIYDSNHIPNPQIMVPPFFLNSGTQYYWRANASNSNGVSTSPWSNVFNFTTLAGPQPNSVSGRVTFVDTNFVTPPNFYTIYAFSSWPPGVNAAQSDSLDIRRTGNTYFADYTIRRLANGNYYIAVTTNGIGLFSQSIMGIYGCDTIHPIYSNCPNNPSTVQIVNNFGIVNINFLSWADTTKKIF